MKNESQTLEIKKAHHYSPGSVSTLQQGLISESHSKAQPSQNLLDGVFHKIVVHATA